MRFLKVFSGFGMNTVDKGNKLEDLLYDYLVGQKERNELVYDVHNPDLCEIFKKKKYYSTEREGDVEFDVVIEITRKASSKPHTYVVFECKNYQNSVPDRSVREFSDKLLDVFRHNSKGIFVVSSPLQSGAMTLVEKRNLGLAKYVEDGFEIALDRAPSLSGKNNFIRNEMFDESVARKPLRFSACFDCVFFHSVDGLLKSLCGESNLQFKNDVIEVPYIQQDVIEDLVNRLLFDVGYEGGLVNLENICDHLNVDLEYSDEFLFDDIGAEILGRANLFKRSITIFSHEYIPRMRFTLAHEIGHFILNHDSYIRSESIVQDDLLIRKYDNDDFEYEKLEIQANLFASCLLLPKNFLFNKLESIRKRLGMKDRGNGYIYVDDQSCNLMDYTRLVMEVATYFSVSYQAVEYRLKALKILTDKRKSKKFGDIARECIG